MTKLREIHRTATFTWSPGQHLPMIATGTVAGALDASFSNTSELALYDIDLDKYGDLSTVLKPVGTLTASAKFNRLAWGNVNSTRPYGILVGGMETGELNLWDPKIIKEHSAAGGSASADESASHPAVIMRNQTHTGGVRGLDFNPKQTNLLASAASNAEIFIWDLNNPTKPYSPSDNRSSKLEDITAVAWNRQVQHILATSSTTGYTVVWDLRQRREVIQLSYPAASGGGPAVGARRSVTAVAWNPENPTQLVTASEDDSSPFITMWDLRHAHSPEKSLSGHNKGILSLSWCEKDSDLLLSCGKDCRTLCWNPRTGENIGELPHSTNWNFEVEWCPRNPDLLAIASFDGKITVHSLQGPQAEAGDAGLHLEPVAQSDDPFAPQIYTAPNVPTSLRLKQPPKWFRRPVGATFGFGGKLCVFDQKATKAVKVHTAVTLPEFVENATSLENALNGKEDWEAFMQRCEQRLASGEKSQLKEDEIATWRVLRTLFAENAREQLMKYLGFEKEDITKQIEGAMSSLGLNKVDVMEHVEPAVVNEETNANGSALTSDDAQTAPAEVTTAPTEDSAEPTVAEGDPASGLFPDSEGQEGSLSGFFKAGDEQEVPETDFFANGAIKSEEGKSVTDEVISPVPAEVKEVKQAAPFSIYAEKGSETDRLITQAAIVGDFESAVNLCLADDRLSDALVFAACGGAELLASTQKAYFAKRASKLPYLRLLQGVVDNKLEDVAQNASLRDWREIVVVLCTFAKSEDFPDLCSILGDRLYTEWQKGANSASSGLEAGDCRRHATLCYLSAGKLDKVAAIWIDLQNEREKSLVQESRQESLYAHHVTSVSELISKVSVFRKAINYEDADLTAEETPLKPKLGPLYERYADYASIAAAQGLTDIAASYASLTPKDFIYRPKFTATDLTTFKYRFAPADSYYDQSSTISAPATSNLQQTYQPAAASQPSNTSQQAYGAVQTQSAYGTGQAPSAYGAVPAQSPYGAIPKQPAYGAASTQPAYGASQTQSAFGSTGYTSAPQSTDYEYGGGQYQPSYTPYQPTPSVPATQPLAPPPMGAAPPTPKSSSRTTTPHTSDSGAWNDPPIRSPANVTQTPAKQLPQRVVSPFPYNANAQTAPSIPGPPPPVGQMSSPYGGQRAQPASAPLPPPPTGASAPTPLYKQTASQQHAYHPQPYVPKSPVSGSFYGNQYGPPPQPAAPQGQPQPQPQVYNPYAPQRGATQLPAPRSNVGQAPVATAKPAGPPAKPEKKRHPVGDREHIPAGYKPIFSILSAEAAKCRQNAPTSQRRQWDDTDGRLNNLFELLNNDEIPKPVCDKLLELSQAMQSKNVDAAHRIHQDLYLTNFDLVGKGLVAIKRILDVQSTQQ
ncbi:hypothetical protein BZG36_02498 [Bifiguratus adelaidae]|uniref:Protein transport protein SEC31 n=1 Tax=Bifiguratus adelaidae TaxID=1938954 RepID=A0A261Y2P0_9FUNG|nr:hypothetical protein BZG36_02498 [Bifiguratus adelaidae]